MAEILVKAISATINSDPEKDRRGCYKRGDPVIVKPDGWNWGSEEGLPKFVRIVVTDATEAQLLGYMNHWQRQIQYTVVGQDLSIDGFRIRVSATLFNATSSEGKITLAMAQNFLTRRWGASIVSFGDNAVTFDILILDAIKSAGFWGESASSLVIVEQTYTQAGGVHRISIDYSTLGISAQRAVFEIGRRKGAFVSHDTVNKIAVAEFTRADVRAAFEAEVKSRLEVPLVRRRFSLPESVIVAAEGSGGVHSMTLAELQAAIRDRTVEVF